MTEAPQGGMQPSDWITLALGAAAFVVSIWSNWISRKSLDASGDQKIAEFRKQWVDELRQDIADFLSAHSRAVFTDSEMKALTAREQPFGSSQWDETVRSELFLLQREKLSAFYALRKSADLIKLRLNLAEKQNSDLIARMENITLSATEPHSQKEIIELSKSILKSEWDRLVKEAKLERN